ncbi:MAG: hypothetical protein ACAI44_25660 [Candidatus Sericytochromatia bacterium]
MKAETELTALLREMAGACAEALLIWYQGKHLTDRLERSLELCCEWIDALGREDEGQKGIYLRVCYTVDKAEADEEFWETSLYWELDWTPGMISCKSYENLATMVGAGQSHIVQISSGDPATPENRERLQQWWQGLKQALEQPDAYVDLRPLRG